MIFLFQFLPDGFEQLPNINDMARIKTGNNRLMDVMRFSFFNFIVESMYYLKEYTFKIKKYYKNLLSEPTMVECLRQGCTADCFEGDDIS